MNTPRIPQQQSGVAAVEFAIVASLFFMVLFGVIEMGRLLWTWNAAVEATRLGTRLAVVCGPAYESNIKARMIERLPALEPGNIAFSYPDFAARVQLSGYTHRTIIPFAPLSVTLPPFSTTLRKEYMDSENNPVCT